MLLQLAILILLSVHGGWSAKVLGVFPTPSYSHQLPLQYMMRSLAERGHHVTVISPNPLKNPPANYTNIDMSFCYTHWKKIFSVNNLHNMSPFEMVGQMAIMYNDFCDLQINSPEIQDLLKSGQKFDLMVYEMIGYQCFYGLGYRLGNPPVVGALTIGAYTPSLKAMGNINFPSISPDVLLTYSDHMTFLERVHNTYTSLRFEYEVNRQIFPKQQASMEKWFGPGVPTIKEMERNVSLLLLGNNWALNYPRPYFPNVVEIVGLHIKDQLEPLPGDIKKFLDDAKRGAVYFSLGSNVKSSELPENFIRVFVEALSKLPIRVLWKWEADSLPNQPSNVMVKKWLPQQEVLAHPNVLVFVTQCGLQSMQEATYYGVPTVMLPFMGDQPHNARRAVDLGVGIQLKFDELTTDSLLDAILQVVNDPSYRKNMNELSSVFRDMTEKSKRDSVWWLEFVLRHRGARSLRPATLDLPWYQVYLLDVIGAALLALAVSLGTFFFAMRRVLMATSRRTTQPSRRTTQHAKKEN